MKITAIVLAAGSGSRMGTKTKKQYLDVCGHPVLFYSMKAFQDSKHIDDIILVASKDDIEAVRSEYTKDQFSKLVCVVPGGKERYNSVYEGLKACMDMKNTDLLEDNYVFIHDGARPFVDESMIERLKIAVKEEKACVAAMPSKDTVKIADDNNYVNQTPDRRTVWNIQTPQCFSLDLIYEAYSELIYAEENGSLGQLHVTDDAMVAEHFASTKIKLIEGSYDNIKITTPVDIILAEAIIGRKKLF